MLVDSLLGQSFNSFELIVVDELYELRAGLLENTGLNVKHLPPRIRHDFYDNSHGWNTGLRVAEGELVTFVVDFCWLYPDFLLDHWGYYKTCLGFSMSGYVDRYQPPPLRSYESDQEVAYSIFNQPINGSWFQGKWPEYRERKGGAGVLHADGTIEMPGAKVYMLNDSIPLSVLKELNGWDEAYDNGYGGNDVDLAVRANLLGWKFRLNPSSVIHKLGTPCSSRVFPGMKKPKARTPEQNFEMFKKRIQAISEGREPIAVPSGRGAWR